MSSKRDNGIKFFEENTNLKEPVVTMFGVKTGDKYDKSHYRWNPQTKKTEYINPTGNDKLKGGNETQKQWVQNYVDKHMSMISNGNKEASKSIDKEYEKLKDQVSGKQRERLDKVREELKDRIEREKEANNTNYYMMSHEKMANIINKKLDEAGIDEFIEPEDLSNNRKDVIELLESVEFSDGGERQDKEIRDLRKYLEKSYKETEEIMESIDNNVQTVIRKGHKQAITDNLVKFIGHDNMENSSKFMGSILAHLNYIHGEEKGYEMLNKLKGKKEFKEVVDWARNNGNPSERDAQVKKLHKAIESLK